MLKHAYSIIYHFTNAKKIINLITDKLIKFKVTTKLKGGNSGNLH